MHDALCATCAMEAPLDYPDHEGSKIWHMQWVIPSKKLCPPNPLNCFTVPPPSHLLPPEESTEDFSDLADLGIVDVVGDDKGGRKIIVVSACRLPGNKGFDNQRFLRCLALLTLVFDKKAGRASWSS